MPQSLARLLVHLVFSTKQREPVLEDAWRHAMHEYMGGITRRCGSELLGANSVSDHVHLLIALSRTGCAAELIREIKTGATKWIHANVPGLGGFHWQAGYGVFSVSPSHKQVVTDYIASQKGHHRQVSFQDEFRRLLERSGVQYDERYLWG